MKLVLAMFFILALAWGRPLAASTPCTPASPCCPCNGKMKCCVGNTGNPSQENPAVPAPTVVQKDLQAALWPVVSVTTPVASNDSRVPATVSAASSARAVPLFVRDCAYLL